MCTTKYCLDYFRFLIDKYDIKLDYATIKEYMDIVKNDHNANTKLVQWVNIYVNESSLTHTTKITRDEYIHLREWATLGVNGFCHAGCLPELIRWRLFRYGHIFGTPIGFRVNGRTFVAKFQDSPQIIWRSIFSIDLWRTCEQKMAGVPKCPLQVISPPGQVLLLQAPEFWKLRDHQIFTVICQEVEFASVDHVPDDALPRPMCIDNNKIRLLDCFYPDSITLKITVSYSYVIGLKRMITSPMYKAWRLEHPSYVELGI